ncbi:MAG: phage tail sheath subtilisin-like domain-containing protein [Pseudobdellovibrionaceae bacterium]|nr:phage tail sheath subtilisin-like domain-containing protein [Pseudobdellovibrionaceae bacterium]
MANNQVPANIEVPFVYIAIDNTGSFEGTSAQNYRVLLIGSGNGSATAGKAYQVSSLAQAKTLFASGSDIYQMAEAFTRNDSISQIHAAAIDGSGLTQASCVLSIALATGATAIETNGSLRITVNDTSVVVAYTTSDTVPSIEKGIKAALAIVPYLEADTTDDGTITITAIPKGEIGNFSISVTEETAGKSKLTVTLTGLTDGKTTNGSAIQQTNFSGIFKNLPDIQYNLIVCSFTSIEIASALKNELSDRFGPLRQKDGAAILTTTAEISKISESLQKLNSQFISILSPGDSLTPAYLFGAATAGQISASATLDPARPFQTLELKGRFAPPRTKPTFSERNNLLRSGISTIVFDQSDTPRIERIVTTYLQNDSGADDRSYHDLNTLLTLSYIRNDFRLFLLNRYGRSKVANDTTRFAAGVQVITPKLAKAETIARFREYESLGFVENVDSLKESLIVRRSAQDPNRLEFILRPNLVNPLTVIGVELGFIL